MALPGQQVAAACLEDMGNLIDAGLGQLAAYRQAGAALRKKRKELVYEERMAVTVRDQQHGLLGFASYQLHVTDQQAKCCYVHELHVSHEWQRKGVGCALLRFVEKVAANSDLREVRLTADNDNSAAALPTHPAGPSGGGFYYKMGYAPRYTCTGTDRQKTVWGKCVDHLSA